MSRHRNTQGSRSLRLFTAGAVATPVTIMAVALAGRHDHQVAALVAMGAIDAIGQTYGAMCPWRANRATKDPPSRDL